MQVCLLLQTTMGMSRSEVDRGRGGSADDEADGGSNREDSISGGMRVTA